MSEETWRVYCTEPAAEDAEGLMCRHSSFVYKENWHDYVSPSGGHAVCACHSSNRATDRGVRTFLCGESVGAIREGAVHEETAQPG